MKSDTLLPCRCVMEIFVFLQMGGERERMVVSPLDFGDAHLHLSLAHFDAAQAQCFLAKDREKLLAVVEGSFGTFEPFNQKVRGFFVNELTRQRHHQHCELSSATITTVSVELRE